MIIDVVKSGNELVAILYCETCGKPFHHKLPKYCTLRCYGKSLEKKKIQDPDEHSCKNSKEVK